MIKQISVANPPTTFIDIGRTGENEFNEIQIDVTEWLTAYPAGTCSVIFRRKDGYEYAVVANSTDNPIVWKPTTTDLAVSGRGKIEVRITSGEVIGKSQMFDTLTEQGIGTPGTPPSPTAPDWEQQVIDASAQVATDKGIVTTAKDTAVEKAQEAVTASGVATQKASDASTSASDAEAAKQAAILAQSASENAKDAALLAESSAKSAKDDAEGARDVAVEVKNSILTDEAARVTAENNRTAAENNRSTAENIRVSAENARKVFEAYSATKAYAVGNKVIYNGSSYLCIQATTAGILPTNTSYFLLYASGGTGTSVISGYTKAGSKTAIADTDTVNQALGKLEFGVDANSASISELNADVDFNVTNLVTNGDFSNGTTGWSTTAGEISAVANTLTQTCNGSAKTAYINQTYTFITNHKYYARAFLRVTNSSCTSLTFRTWASGVVYEQVISNPVINTWYPFSFLATAGTSGTNGIFALQAYIDAATANGKVMEVQYVLAIDLTAAFGAGNEPTAAEMDAILAFYPNSWFNGTKNLAANPKMLPYLLNTLRSKADKAQEAWITPTFLNGWTQYDATNYPVGYYKDSLGVVHLRGMVATGTYNTVAFTLPTGYRPAKFSYFPGRSYNSFASTNVQSAGSVIPSTIAYTTYVALDGISFRAEG